MKRALIIVAALLAGALAFGQSLTENSYYQKSLELEALARQAFEEGDYDSAADYAAQAQENARLSDEYVAKMLDMKAAQDAIRTAEERVAWATGFNAEKRYPAEMADAAAELAEAKALYTAEDYASARMHAELVLVALQSLSDELPLPASFVVRRVPGNEDCLWRIAALPFVYNDPWMWTVLYKANKAKLPVPADPDLILPGMVIVIPSLSGEYRDGVYDPKLQYPAYTK